MYFFITCVENVQKVGVMLCKKAKTTERKGIALFFATPWEIFSTP